MQSLTEKVFKLAPPGGLFDETVIRNLFMGSSDGGRALLVHRACQAGEILRLKPGLFVLGPPYRKSEPHPFVLAAGLHAPSHISLESALAHHGLIPEAVYQVSSATVGRSREFSTPLGVFSFRRVPARAPRAGVEVVAVARNAWAFIALPLRAIADAVYLNKQITWNRNGLGYLTESLRIEEDDLQSLSFETLDEILNSIRSHRVRTYLEGLKGAISHAG
ncbi:MAG: type IV toxin-antitoxin system AbiEi family antitoxin domain-containing protein [Verrucomicrobiia bacterium]